MASASFGGKKWRRELDAVFMVGIRIPNGLLTPHRRGNWRNFGRIWRSLADITVRQNIQLHWVTIENIPDLLERLHELD